MVTLGTHFQLSTPPISSWNAASNGLHPRPRGLPAKPHLFPGQVQTPPPSRCPTDARSPRIRSSLLFFHRAIGRCGVCCDSLLCSPTSVSPAAVTRTGQRQAARTAGLQPTGLGKPLNFAKLERPRRRSGRRDRAVSCSPGDPRPSGCLHLVRPRPPSPTGGPPPPPGLPTAQRSRRASPAAA